MKAAILIVIAAIFLLVSNALYKVNETQQVIITQFGKPVGDAVTTAGLKFKVPFIQKVNPIEKRILEWDGNPSNMPTKDKLYIAVDLFARWRIVDPLQYLLRLRDERSAQSRLDDILGSETRNAVAKHELIEIIRTTKDRQPLLDASLTEEDLATLGTLYQFQRDVSWWRKRFSSQPQQRLKCSALSYSIFDSSASTTTKAYALKFTIE